eukprot:TRINITY_DN74809_c0_g1_i1.p1 TRINITY_DN74809_c0_g1~~TRINITY_DN74809_c0_g1_i1.p1  ORF type:complete len:407 (-),score=54.21 TRINITY_DN74809_c0_g1_i1:96-1271(-)
MTSVMFAPADVMSPPQSTLQVGATWTNALSPVSAALKIDSVADQQAFLLVAPEDDDDEEGQGLVIEGRRSSGPSSSPCSVGTRPGTSGGGGAVSSAKQHEPVKHLEQWRVICIDFHRFRSKYPDKCKALIRQGIPEFLRGAVWQKLALSRDKYPADVYHQMCLTNDAPCEGDIVRDINRTFPKHVLYRDRQGLGQQQLLNVLRAYSVFNAEVGYCQGMGFICGILLMYMREDDAFLMLISLLDNYKMSGLFMPDLPLLNKYFFQLQRLLEMQMPVLYNHLVQQGVEPTMYASEWFMTVCIYNFPFSTVVRVWDIFLAEGVKIIFRIALAILKLNQETLLSESFEQILVTLKQAPSRIESDTLIRVGLSIKLKNKTLKDIEAEWLTRTTQDL